MKTFQQFVEAFNSALNWNVLPSARTKAAVATAVPDGEVTYHKDIGLPNEFEKPKPGLALRYGTHSVLRAEEKGIVLPKVVPASFSIIEVTMLKYRVTKWVIRFPINDIDDVVIVLSNDSNYSNNVKTAWINKRSDKHGTLDRSKYSAKPAF